MPTVDLLIGGTSYYDVTLFSTLHFESQVNAAPGTCQIRLRDANRTISIPTGAEIVLLIDGDAAWRGYVSMWKRIYVFPAINIDAFGETRFFDIEGVDINVLFNKRFVFNQDDPEIMAGTLFGPDTDDTTAITDLIANFLDLSSDSINTTTFVENVGTITEDQDGRAWEASDSWGQAMQSITMLPNAIYYLLPHTGSPDAYLVYTDVDTPNASMALSDVVTPGAATYSNMEILLDGSSLANDVMAWGAGYGSQTPVFVRDEDAASQAAHGLWQVGVVRYGIYKQGTINRLAASIIDGSPQSKRGAKDNRTSVTLTTYQTGFLPSQKVDFTSEVFGFNDVIPIRKMEITFEAPDNPKYVLTLSHDIDSPLGYFDPWMWSWRFPPFGLPPLPGIPPWVTPGGECTTCGITDDFDRTESGVWGVATCGLMWRRAPFTSGGTISVDGDAGVIFLDDTDGCGMLLGGSSSSSHQEPVTLAVKSMRFQLPDYVAGGNNSYTLAWSPMNHPGIVVGPVIGIGSDGTLPTINSYIDYVTASSNPIPPAFWNASSTYTWTVWQTVTGQEQSITDGVNTYGISTSSDPTVAMCSLTFDFNSALAADITLRVLEIDIPEIDFCSVNGFCPTCQMEMVTFDDWNRTEVGDWGIATPSGFAWDTSTGNVVVGVDGTSGWADLVSEITTTGLIAQVQAVTPEVDPAPWGSPMEMLATFQYDTPVPTDSQSLGVRFELHYVAGSPVHEPACTVNIIPGFSEIRITNLYDSDQHLQLASIFEPPHDTPIHVRWQFVDGGISRARIWWDPDPEPSSWTVTSSDIGLGRRLGYFDIISGVFDDNELYETRVNFDNLGFLQCGPGTGSMPVGFTGYGCQVATRISESVYRTTNAMTANSSTVFINGVLQRRGGLLDYTEDPSNGEIVFNGPEFPEEDDEVKVCYQSQGPL